MGDKVAVKLSLGDMQKFTRKQEHFTEYQQVCTSQNSMTHLAMTGMLTRGHLQTCTFGGRDTVTSVNAGTFSSDKLIKELLICYPSHIW